MRLMRRQKDKARVQMAQEIGLRDPQNRLDAALDRLEEVVASHIRYLREAIEWRREQGPFDEEDVAEAIEQVAYRDQVANLVEVLTGRLLGEETPR